MGRKPLPLTVSALASASDDENLALLRTETPHDGHTRVEIPAGFLAKLCLRLIPARHLGGQHGRHAREPTVRAQLRAAPDGSVGRTDRAGEHHARFVRPDLEL